MKKRNLHLEQEINRIRAQKDNPVAYAELMAQAKKREADNNFIKMLKDIDDGNVNLKLINYHHFVLKFCFTDLRLNLCCDCN